MHQQLYELLHLHKIVVIKESNDFTWSSGLKSPIYCDLRKAWSFVNLRNALINAVADSLKHDFFNFVMGMATAGIIPAALVAQELCLPVGYLRKATKSHGTKQIIEGEITDKDKLIIIEDTVSTGKSVLNAVQSLSFLQVKPTIMTIWTNCPQKTKQIFKKHNYNFKELLNFPEYLEYLRDRKLITKNAYDHAKNFVLNLETTRNED